MIVMLMGGGEWERKQGRDRWEEGEGGMLA